MFRYGRIKNEEKPFVGFASIDISDGISWKFWIAKIASTFTVEALAICETLVVIEKIESEQNIMIFSDSESVLKGIRNKYTTNNASHIAKMLKDKIESLESRGKKYNFTGSRGTMELKLMRELTRRQSNQSKMAEIVNYYYHWQILKPNGKRKTKRSFIISVKTPKGQRRIVL
jgi:hypothetical protein